MSKQNKWAGSFGKTGDSASGGRSTQGNVYSKAPRAGAAQRDSSSKSDNVINCKTGPGDNMGTQSISSHNNINAFTRGIKSRGPYGGPTFASINSSKQNMQMSNTSGISKFPTPSSGAGGHRGTSNAGAKTGGTRVGYGNAKSTTPMAKAPRSNKSGSGHMASVR